MQTGCKMNGTSRNLKMGEDGRLLFANFWVQWPWELKFERHQECGKIFFFFLGRLPAVADGTQLQLKLFCRAAIRRGYVLVVINWQF